MFESFGFETLTPANAAILLGLLLGLAFGFLAQRSQFCLTRGLRGTRQSRFAALGVFGMAMVTAIAGTRIIADLGLVSFADHRFFATEFPIASILVGGAIFGVGMTLTRGCPSRLAVLGGSGNLRALFVLGVFAIAAHATTKGILAPLRLGLGTITIDLNVVALSQFAGSGVWAWVLAGGILLLSLRSGAPRKWLLMGATIGCLVPLAWLGTGFILQDLFDPLPMQSLGFTQSAAESLFWAIAATSIPAGFSQGLLGGVILGSLVAARLAGDFQWQQFESPGQTGRYMGGAVMMGLGGVLAGGCTIGAGVAGVSTTSLAAMLALGTMMIVGRATSLRLEKS